MSNTICSICTNSNNNTSYEVKEMQLGLREKFTYIHCANCGCLQLKKIPDDLGKYYPNEDYYSFNLGLDIKDKPDLLRKIKSSYLIYGKHPLLGRLLSLGYKSPDYFSWMKIPGIKYEDAILDVGTGNGSLLASLFKNGFTNLTGIDPFINADKDYGKVKIYKKDIYELQGQYDYIMLHHAFEHMDAPLKVLQRLFELLKKGKYLLIRTPMMGMYSWKKYRENWMDIDAPRHIFIHSPQSMKLLAEKAGFIIKKIVYDSNYMSFIGSEQYQNDIALPDANSYSVDKAASGFSQETIEQFKKKAIEINNNQQGDQAAFYLFKP